MIHTFSDASTVGRVGGFEQRFRVRGDTKSRALLKPFSFRLFVNHFLIITDRDGAVDALR